MKEKLRQLLEECDNKLSEKYLACKTCEEQFKLWWSDVYAEHLINNGVLVPPCKVGDKIYFPHEAQEGVDGWIDEGTVCVANSRKDIVYILVNYDTSIEEDIYRIRKVVEMGFLPDVRVYRKPFAPQILRDLQRWCNNRILYRSVDFAEYIPRKSVGLSMKLMYPEYDLRIFNSY